MLIKCIERRNKKLRPREGWHKTTAWPYRTEWPRALWRDYCGHHIIVTPRPENIRVYDMWMDGYYKGCRNTRRVAKRALTAMALSTQEVKAME